MPKIAIIGLGYVGLPLANLFAKKYQVVGFDVDSNRIKELQNGIDSSKELENFSQKIIFTSKQELIKDCNIYIVAVPTPVDNDNLIDPKAIIDASKIVASVLKKNDIVIYESTVYPTMTKEKCVPVLEQFSNLKFNRDFFVGYSPERINPGDKIHSIEKIKKVTSGSTPKIAKIVDDLYNSVLENGTFLASSIEVAEASKIIENAQRDVNIAFINEIQKIFDAMNIDIFEVLEASKTKWNFLDFRPGLVGGHCIGVDPYYLIQKAQVYGILPRVMTSARSLNESMGEYYANKLVKQMNLNGILVKDSKILILGFAFKENCCDIRNTKVVDIYSTLKEFTQNIDIVDPMVNQQKVFQEYNIQIKNNLDKDQKYDAIILAVAHKNFQNININDFKKEENSVVLDIKGMFK